MKHTDHVHIKGRFPFLIISAAVDDGSSFIAQSMVVVENSSLIEAEYRIAAIRRIDFRIVRLYQVHDFDAPEHVRVEVVE